MVSRSVPGAPDDGPVAGPFPAEPRTFARHGRLPRSRPVKTLLKAAGLALAVLVVSSTAVAGLAIVDVTAALKPGVSLPGAATAPDPGAGAIDGGVNLLLVGSDSGQGDPRYGDRGEHLGDVTALLHISKDHTWASVISFPRDLFVTIPACPASPSENAEGTEGGFTDKLNSALSYGGLACTVATIQNLTGTNIPYAAEIEFNGVIEMSNAVGGVPVCVASPIRDEYTGTFLSPGEHVLSGWAALQFLRTRHGLSTGSDLARIGSQQAFLASLLRTVTSNGTLSNPLTLYSLAKAAASNMRLSTSLQHPDTMVSIALAVQGMNLAQVSFLQYPVDEVDGGLEPRAGDAEFLFKALAADTPIHLHGELGPASAAAPTGSPSVSSPTPAAATPTASAAPQPEAVDLPPSISGQTAEEQTCAVGGTQANE